MSVQSDFKDKMISVEYISKKGKEMCHSVIIPIGRKIKQAMLQERRREDFKSFKNASVSRKGDSLSTGHICTSTTTLDTPLIQSSTCFANSILIARVKTLLYHILSTITTLCPSCCKCKRRFAKCICRIVLQSQE